MPSPFDYSNSFNKTKKSLIDSEEIFQKEYTPFIINRIIANNPGTIMFANEMNLYPDLDKKLQHDFYLLGLPRNSNYVKYIKKESTDVDESLLQFIQQELDVSYSRAFDIYNMLGEQVIKNLLSQRGGREWTNKKNKNKSESK